MDLLPVRRFLRPAWPELGDVCPVLRDERLVGAIKSEPAGTHSRALQQGALLQMERNV